MKKYLALLLLLVSAGAGAATVVGEILVNPTIIGGTASGLTGVAPTGTAGGDLSGTYPNPTVSTVNGGQTIVPAGTLTNGALCKYASTPAINCGTAAPSGAIVGDTDTQTLTNKTLGSPVVTGTGVTSTIGTSRTLANAAEIIVCTGACTVTPPGSATPGMQFCAQNDDNIATVITLAAVSGVQYEVTARTSYKTANTALASSGAVKDQICMMAISATKWNVFSSIGTWN